MDINPYPADIKRLSDQELAELIAELNGIYPCPECGDDEEIDARRLQLTEEQDRRYDLAHPEEAAARVAEERAYHRSVNQVLHAHLKAAKASISPIFEQNASLYDRLRHR